MAIRHFLNKHLKKKENWLLGFKKAFLALESNGKPLLTRQKKKVGQIFIRFLNKLSNIDITGK
jgi:hypothetical protein